MLCCLAQAQVVHMRRMAANAAYGPGEVADAQDAGHPSVVERVMPTHAEDVGSPVGRAKDGCE